jgi:predicted nucleic acid-binding protein
MVLADTLFLLDLMRGRERAVEMMERLEAQGEPIHVTSVTLFEFHRGLETVDLPAAEKRRVVETVEGRVVLALDATAAARAGGLDARLWAAGEALDPEDAMVAGIALSRDEEVVTRKAREFGRVPGLRLRTY